MQTSVMLWIVLAILSTLFVVVLCLTGLLLWRWHLRSLSLLQQQSHEQLALLDKALALVASGDALTYQQLQVMNPASGYDEPTFDPSDAGEIERIRHESPLAADLGDLSDYEHSIAADFGLDTE